jgi:hypothetical protein
MATTRNDGRRKPGKRPPVLVKVGCVVRIQFSPRKTNRTWHDSWWVDYSMYGRRCRDRRNTFRKARIWANEMAVKTANGEMKSLALTGEDHRIYLTSRENIKGIEGLKVQLDAANRESADAKGLVKNADLRKVGRFYNRYAQQDIRDEGPATRDGDAPGARFCSWWRISRVVILVQATSG